MAARKQDSATVDRESIEKRAYEVYIARGGAHGADLDDWLEAERQVREENGAKRATTSRRKRATTAG